MTRGRAARVAVDAKVLVAFIDAHSEYRVDGNPRRRRHYINGVCLDQDNSARIIRRWRTKIEGVTPQAADRLLEQVNLSLNDLASWAQDEGRQYLLRGAIK
ncbi:MAG: hypothetical protein ACXVGC_12650 [Mycobacteriaceae bacterium]